MIVYALVVTKSTFCDLEPYLLNTKKKFWIKNLIISTKVLLDKNITTKRSKV